MKTYKAAQGLMALGSLHAVVGAPHPESVPITSGANIYSMENTTAYSLHSAAEAELATSLRVPHDLPSHPHCTYKGPGSRMYMVFSKDFGRHDETSQDGCGNHMLLHLREGTFWLRRTNGPPFYADVFAPSQALPNYIHVNLTEAGEQNALTGL